MNGLQKFLFDDSAATTVEYAVMLALILMAMIATIVEVGANTAAMYDNSRAQMEAHGFGP
jgi:Flp pilus assembly pilin Flp